MAVQALRLPMSRPLVLGTGSFCYQTPVCRPASDSYTHVTNSPARPRHCDNGTPSFSNSWSTVGSLSGGSNSRPDVLLQLQMPMNHILRCYSSRGRNYYDSLELTPKATASQVKAAYYRLSKQYHPDMNKTEGAKHKFAEISEAYEILGNQKSRREYDRGFVNPSNFSSNSAYDADYQDFVRNRDKFARKGKPPTGRGDHYNFDEFYKQHYGDYVRQHHEHKASEAAYKNARKIERENLTRRNYMYASLLSFVVVVSAFFMKIRKP